MEWNEIVKVSTRLSPVRKDIENSFVADYSVRTKEGSKNRIYVNILARYSVGIMSPLSTVLSYLTRCGVDVGRSA